MGSAQIDKCEEPEEIINKPKKAYSFKNPNTKYKNDKINLVDMANGVESLKYFDVEMYSDEKKIESTRKIFTLDQSKFESKKKEYTIDPSNIEDEINDIFNKSPRKSQKVKNKNNSICYNGEFSIILQQNELNELTNTTEKPITLLKDISFFDILKVIGRGSFGKVVLVRNKIDKKLLALKCFKKDQIIKNKTIECIKNEKKILENLDNPFIIKLKLTFQNKEKIFMAFDYYNGGELFFHLQKFRKFEEHVVKFYAAEIYLALTYLHSKNILYRDLKPENIILDKFGHIKLIDFGLAKDMKVSNNYTNTLCGTNEYIPPEVICGKNYSYNFDWWCFGNIIYELLNGHPAFTDKIKTRLFKKIVNKEISFESLNITNDCKQFLSSLLNKDPDKRIKPCDIKFHPWFKTINFDEIASLKVVPPFIPKIKNEEDLTNIDPNFLKESINSPIKSNKIEIDQAYFSDF